MIFKSEIELTSDQVGKILADWVRENHKQHKGLKVGEVHFNINSGSVGYDQYDPYVAPCLKNAKIIVELEV